MLRKLCLKITAAELAIYGSAIFFTTLFWILFYKNNNTEGNFVVYYAKLLIHSLIGGGEWFLILLGFSVFLYLYAMFFLSLARGIKPTIYFSRERLRNFIVVTRAKYLPPLIRFATPLVISFVLFGLNLSYINSLNASNLRDELLLSSDRALTGLYPFIFLGNIHYPKWAVEAVDFSFGSLPLFFAVFLIYLLFTKKDLFLEAATAFTMSLLVSLPFWIMIPAMSPHDRFIDNIYNLEINSETQKAIATYQPQAELRKFLEKIRESKNRLGNNAPTTTFPSAHIEWALLFAYYGFWSDKRLLFAILPLAILSSFGTIFFAQHYFVDIPAGVVIGAIAITIAKLLRQLAGYKIVRLTD